MTSESDKPSDPPPDTDPALKPKPRAHLPRVSPVFGRFGFVICVMPYIVFLLGNHDQQLA